MGKVLTAFRNGYPGAISRAVDDIVISLANAGAEDIPFGAPVFLSADRKGVVPFSTDSPQDYSSFVGFAVRSAAKTPDTYPGGAFADPPRAAWKPGDPVDILVRGCIALAVTSVGQRGGNLYIVKADGKLTPSAGEEGTTVLLENVKIRTPKDASGCCEAVVTERKL